jgi:hypothetical protein
LPHSADSPPNIIFESRERRTVASYERELKRELIRHRPRKPNCERLSPKKKLCFIKRTS